VAFESCFEREKTKDGRFSATLVENGINFPSEPEKLVKVPHSWAMSPSGDCMRQCSPPACEKETGTSASESPPETDAMRERRMSIS
jgi:hypothetical protein